MARQTEFAVVLGSGLQANGEASAVTALRAKTAAALAVSKSIKLILSGSRALDDSGEHGKTEALVMAEIAKSEGVGTDMVLLEDQSFDTFGNAIFTAMRYLKHLEPGTLYVVTSLFHMERAVFIFQKVFGEKWTIVAHEAPEWSGETRQSGAQAAMERARLFFSDVETGNLDACFAKLKKLIPAYQERVA